MRRMILWGIWFLLLAGFSLADTYVRQPSVDVLLYDISIEFTDASDSITGVAKVHIRMQSENVRNMWLDFAGMQIDSLQIDGIKGTYSHQNDKLSVEFSPPYSKGEVAIIEVHYHGKPGNKGMWIRENQYHRRALFTNNWPNYAHYWFPAIDHPYDKAKVNLSVTAPAKYEVISNGLRTSMELLPNGRKITQWKENRPIPTYCIAIGIAEFLISPQKESSSTPIQWYAFSEDAKAAAQKFQSTDVILDYFKSLIGPFPYEKLAQVQASIPFEGMENASVIFYSESLFKDKPVTDDPVPHEIAHQWFGDSVTIADWDDLWLSEGFATYFDALFQTYAHRSESIQHCMEKYASELQEYERAHTAPVIDTTQTDPMKKLNPLNYQKGAWILHMLRGMVGDKPFFEGIRRYYHHYAHGNARSEDFIKIMESASNRSLVAFFHQWLFQSGWPEYRAQWRWDEKNHAVILSIRQEQANGFFDMLLDIAFYSKDKQKTLRLRINEEEHQFCIPLPDRPISILIDPNNWVLKSLKIETL
jgi:aminopeptidase N